MAEEKHQVPRVKLGTQGLEVSKLGYGCMNLSGGYSSPVSEEDGISMIKHAFSKGITFFDTADVYGQNANEVLLGKALKQLPREKMQVATKFGIAGIGVAGVIVKGAPDYVRSCCEASLKRLDVDYIDLYYQHRVDTSVPIEETIGEMKKLVEEGKIKYIGLSEASPGTIRRAHAVHPITAVQMEWSLWTRDIEEEIIPLCRELGIGIVPYSPLGRGFFGGKAVVENVPADSFLVLFSVNVYPHHFVSSVRTTKMKNLDDNIDSLRIKLTKEDLKEISDAVPIEEVAGNRDPEGFDKASWKFANTPPKDCKVSKLGFGCMSLSGGYNSRVSEEDGISIMKHAFNKGITFFDTADRYGPYILMKFFLER
ncbi:Aldo ket red domain-containing protein [Citrus sinensis]|uniref:Aldo ket red domain-containing protein n=1 Tax=Citrus sinensis TaxID=2711 RepID=A0ACB8KI42_CITSI|nr:Aldo ket red domain-containing protein [Citrus sinensis]